ncbi:MAG: YjjG family noncanonical pyrimidine nucleotidase [Bacteroidia bacterium]
MYKHLFFDLDRTLWDFEKNCEESLSELAIKHNLKAYGIDSISRFTEYFIEINEQLWEDYGQGLISKQQIRNNRFPQLFLKYKLVNDQLATTFALDYTAITPLKKNLLPDTLQVLNYLKEKYTLHIITNGFEETQLLKLKECNIDFYFSEIITSERAGFKKPDIGVFNFSLALTKATVNNSVMIGDSLSSDIIGARQAGMHQIYLNRRGDKHSEAITYEIRELNELMKLL